MKIGRFEAAGDEPFWAVVSSDESTATRLNDSFASWAPQLSMADEVPAALLGAEYEVANLTLRVPLETGARIWAVGINYMKHIDKNQDVARESLAERPKETAGFIKPASALLDPDGVSRLPAHTEKLDYEIELVLVVAEPLERGKDPRASLLGYTIGNDGSIRDAGRPMSGPDLYSMKAQDGLSAVGPWVATLGSVGGPTQPDLEMTTLVNGELRQHDRTKDMIFPVDYMLRYVNERNELRPGDLIYTGTPAGTCADAGHPFLQTGDEVEMTIEGIGTLRYSIGEKLPARL
jgi:2-keto-4-pentenoate hydratase/2-oxohepta-3-ene-1,7-dioic acid hydratase in catechol pathway